MTMPRSALLLLTLVACARGAPDSDTGGDPARPAGVPGDWVYHDPDSLPVRWWAPETFAASDDWRALPPCNAGTLPADSGVAPIGGDETALPLTVAVRRGSMTDVVRANHFWEVENGQFATDGRGSGEAIVERGPGWIVLAGDVWVGTHAPEGGSMGQEPVAVLLGIRDVGAGCQLVFLERGGGGEVGSIDTLALVLRSVGPRP